MSLRIFIVEDNLYTLEQLRDLLNGIEGITVIASARTQDAALAWLEAHASECDAIVLDVMLASGSGLGVLSAFDVRRHGVACAVFTNYHHEHFVRRCRALGATEVVDKSGSPERLIECLSEWSRQRGGEQASLGFD